MRDLRVTRGQTSLARPVSLMTVPLSPCIAQMERTSQLLGVLDALSEHNSAKLQMPVDT